VGKRPVRKLEILMKKEFFLAEKACILHMKIDYYRP
jgi:hypothetical protein